MLKEIELGCLYKIRDHKKELVTIRAVDGEEVFRQPGLSSGFIHFANPYTDSYMGFCGISYFKEFAKKVEGNK